MTFDGAESSLHLVECPLDEGTGGEHDDTIHMYRPNHIDTTVVRPHEEVVVED